MHFSNDAQIVPQRPVKIIHLCQECRMYSYQCYLAMDVSPPILPL